MRHFGANDSEQGTSGRAEKGRGIFGTVHSDTTPERRFDIGLGVPITRDDHARPWRFPILSRVKLGAPGTFATGFS